MSGRAEGGSLYFTYLADYDAHEQGQDMLFRLAKRGAGAVLPEATLTNNQPERETALERLLAVIQFEVELTRQWWVTGKTRTGRVGLTP